MAAAGALGARSCDFGGPGAFPGSLLFSRRALFSMVNADERDEEKCTNIFNPLCNITAVCVVTDNVTCSTNKRVMHCNTLHTRAHTFSPEFSATLHHVCAEGGTRQKERGIYPSARPVPLRQRWAQALGGEVLFTKSASVALTLRASHAPVLAGLALRFARD